MPAASAFSAKTWRGIPNDRVYALRRKLQIVFQIRSVRSIRAGRSAGCGASPCWPTRRSSLRKGTTRLWRQWNGAGCRPIWLHAIRISFPAVSASASPIARAIVTEPELIVADEAGRLARCLGAGQVLNLFMDLQEELGLAMLFISHDLAVVASLCDRIAVMQTGRIVEQATARDILSAPKKRIYPRAL